MVEQLVTGYLLQVVECKFFLTWLKEWYAAQQGPECPEELKQALRAHAAAAPPGSFWQAAIGELLKKLEAWPVPQARHGPAQPPGRWPQARPDDRPQARGPVARQRGVLASHRCPMIDAMAERYSMSEEAKEKLTEAILMLGKEEGKKLLATIGEHLEKG